MPLKIAFDGGKCCGVKIIHGFTFNYEGAARIDDPQWELALEKKSFKQPDAYGHDVSSNYNMYHLQAPQESPRDRFKRYLKYLEEWRPSGIVIVNLCEDKPADSYGQEFWFPIVEEHGFKLVARFKNSNSGRFVRTYMLRYGQQDAWEDEEHWIEEDEEDVEDTHPFGE